MRTINEIKNNEHKLKVAKWFGAIIFIALMYGLLGDFGLLAALVLLYIFIV